MNSYGTLHRRLRKLLRSYGLSLEMADHCKVKDSQGKTVATVAGSPSCPYFAENAVKELVAKGMLPASARRVPMR
jgi:hypothetical protein